MSGRSNRDLWEAGRTRREIVKRYKEIEKEQRMMLRQLHEDIENEPLRPAWVHRRPYQPPRYVDEEPIDEDL